MRLSLLAAASSLVGVAFSQLGDLPSCAQNCVNSFTTGDKIGNCGSLDIACICSSASFLSDIACCLAGACDAADQKTATDFALTFCKAGGVTGLPTAVSCTTGTAASTGSHTQSSGSPTSSGPATTSAPATTSGSATSSGSETSSGSATGSGSATSSGAGTTSGSASSVTSAPASVQSQSGTPSASSSPSSTKNVGAQNMAGVGAGVVGGVAAFVAALL